MDAPLAGTVGLRSGDMGVVIALSLGLLACVKLTDPACLLWLTFRCSFPKSSVAEKFSHSCQNSPKTLREIRVPRGGASQNGSRVRRAARRSLWLVASASSPLILCQKAARLFRLQRLDLLLCRAKQEQQRLEDEAQIALCACEVTELGEIV